MLTRDAIYDMLEEAFKVTQMGVEAEHVFSRDVQLLGENGVFDSLDTMLFLDMVDDMLSAKVGYPVDLIDGSAFSRPDNPFANMRTLADYIEELLRPE